MNAIPTHPSGQDQKIPAGHETPPPHAPHHGPIWRHRRFRLAVLALAVIAVGAAGTGWYLDRSSHVFLDDARVAGNLVTVSSEVDGRVDAVDVVAGDAIERGAKMIGIDRTQEKLELAALNAQIAEISAQQEQLRAQQGMIRTQTARKLEANQAELKAAEAADRAAQATLDNARSQFERYEKLAKRGVASQQQLDQARADFTTAQQDEQSAAAGVATARANLAVTKSADVEINVLDRQIATLEIQKTAQTAERDAKQVDIERGTILADFDGVIDKLFIDAGEYVSAGKWMLIYHDPKVVWIDANVKETDFDRLKIGAPARITVDAYPGREFEGKVIRLGGAATSEFALLPSPNPSGNFTKVTQRLPIRISVNQKDDLLRPGMMVEVNIDVVD